MNESLWIQVNPNPCRTETEDCVVRAIALATNRTWREVHWDLCVMSNELCTMPSVNWLWGEYLKRLGFTQFMLPESCPECVTVRKFCRMYPHGTYIIGTGHHAICIRNGCYMDAWDSGDERPTYFYKKKGR